MTHAPSSHARSVTIRVSLSLRLGKSSFLYALLTKTTQMRASRTLKLRNAGHSQAWTTLRDMQVAKKHKNVFKHDPYHSGVISIWTEPKVAIGQRAFLLCTEVGNVMWDCITYIDDETIKRVRDLGGISAIVISHPHYYSTAQHWGETFGCRVYISAEDERWLMRKGEAHSLWAEPRLELLGGRFVAVKVGGHFPGSSVMLWRSERKLFVADSIQVVPSGVYHVDRLPDTASFTFMWSYPNMVSSLTQLNLI